MQIQLTPKQKIFFDSKCDEVFFGGAAGGGKSFGQLMDALIYSQTYAGSKQLILRRLYPELSRSLIPESRKLYPKELGKYNTVSKLWRFKNGSTIEFGAMDNEYDVTKYQSAEYDVIRFDELGHFTEYQYDYMKSRLRGVNNFPKQIKSTGNPGGIGHSFIRKRFIDNGNHGQPFEVNGRQFLFIPAFIIDNPFLMEKDPEYIKRLETLPETERKQLLEGDWYAFDGQFFKEFDRNIHIIKPFQIPNNWTIFISLDYGLDMAAAYWWAVDEQNRCYVYKEMTLPNLSLSKCANEINYVNDNDNYEYIVASPDLWHRRQDTGKSGIEILLENGLRNLVKANNKRVQGWRALREALQPFKDEQDVMRAKLSFFSNVKEITTTLPLLQSSPKKPDDVADTDHKISHFAESIRYGVMSRPEHREKTEQKDVFKRSESEYDRELADFIGYGL